MDTNPNPKKNKRSLPKTIALLGCLILTIAGISRITVDVDILKLLPRSLPQVQGLGLFLRNFSQPDQLLLTVEGETPEATAAAATEIALHLESQPALVRSVVSSPPWETNPADSAELAAYIALNRSPEDFAQLHERLSPEKREATLQGTLEHIAESVSPQETALAAFDPYGILPSLDSLGLHPNSQKSEFVSANGLLRILYVHSLKRFTTYKENIRWIEELKETVAPWRRKTGLRLGFTGEPSFIADVSSTMEWDMSSSGVGTMLLIALVFWGCYRRAKPLMSLQLMLLVTFAITLGLAGLLLKQLTIIGVGCAAIMIGLSVDYGYFVYQRSLQHKGTVRELQSQCWQYIAWTSGTTAAAFFSLNLSSLPGLSQLGNLVGIGVIVGAIVMLTIFAPLTLAYQQSQTQSAPSAVERLVVSPRFLNTGFYLTLALTVFLLGMLWLKGAPKTDFSPGCLRPRKSEAYDTLERLSANLMDTRRLLHLIVQGSNEREVRQKLEDADRILTRAKDEGHIRSFISPLSIWPNPEAQQANLAQASSIAKQSQSLKESALKAGFTEDAFVLTERILQQWDSWATNNSAGSVIWPQNESSRWVLHRMALVTPSNVLAAGLVTPEPGHEDALLALFRNGHTFLVNWPQLGRELQQVVPKELVVIMAALTALVVFLLAFALRNVKALVCFVLTTVLVLLCLTAAMSLLDMSWNLFNMAAFLLLLGTGTDYSILILLSLKRNGNDVEATQKELFLVILLCATSAATGFGTIGWANHMGLAALGQTCGMGLALDALISLFLLPPMWKALNPVKQ
ncbi:MAG: MMPL family transporter [Verrucomicrobiota bacterium]